MHCAGKYFWKFFSMEIFSIKKKKMYTQLHTYSSNEETNVVGYNSSVFFFFFYNFHDSFNKNNNDNNVINVTLELNVMHNVTADPRTENKQNTTRN